MDSAPHYSYWETQVLTSTPQKLRLMLIEGAITFSRQALDHWQADRIEAGFTAAQRCQEILFELLGTVRASGSPINRSISEIYIFLVKEIQLAIRHHDAEVMTRILRVLEEERSTWQQICEKYPHAPTASPAEERPEITALHLPAIQPETYSFVEGTSRSSHGTFSLDA